MAATATPNQLGYKALPLAGLIADLLPPVNLYLRSATSNSVHLYRSRDLPISTSDINELRANDVTELWVDLQEYAQIKRFLEDNLAALLNDESHSPMARLRLLNQVIIETLRETFPSGNAERCVEKTRELAPHVVDLGVRSEIAIREVARIANHDFCTFAHSANVASYATLLAHTLGITDTEELQEIASAGMLHDLGKLRIPKEILSKPGRLTKEEFSVVRLHPTHGFQQLRNQRLSTGQLLMVYQHHEWMNGTGYPVGCVAADLHLWSRICSVVDVFEALTGKRPYRRPNSIEMSLEIMQRESGAQFDAEIFDCWKSQFATAPKTKASVR